MPTLPPDAPPFEVMCHHLTNAAQELFSDFSIEVVPTDRGVHPSKEHERVGVSVIGYAGRGVKGALVLRTDEQALHTWMAAAGVPDGDLADTLGEFSNMLLGRLKARLLPLGISILSTTPTSVVARDLRLSDPPGPFKWESLAGPDWSLKLRLEADFEPGFLPLTPALPETTAQSGDVIEFELPEREDKI